MSELKKHRKLILFLADLAVFWITTIVIYTISKHDNATHTPKEIWVSFLALYASVAIVQIAFRTYNSLWRYAGIGEYLSLSISTALGYLLFVVIAAASAYVWLAAILTFSITAAYLLLTILMRLVYRRYREGRVHKEQKKLMQGGKIVRKVAIIGAGEAGVGLLRNLEQNVVTLYKVSCFFDDDPEKLGQRVRGVPVRATIGDALEYLKKHPVDELILAIPSLSSERRKDILGHLSDLPCQIKILPDTAVALSKGSNDFTTSVRNINIEDLLGRNTANLNTEEIKGMISNQVVLVTGGGGSIGSELCRQIARLNPKKLVLFDIAENPSYLLKQEVARESNGMASIRVEIGSIRDEKRVDELFDTYRPNVVFHAAAHKHVPLMEWNPEEAIKNNIFGTWNVMQASAKYGVKKFIQISTDKAVCPTSVMGATKRYCEYMVHAMANEPDCKTSFSAVRFGNVLGSSGSVVPIFKAQIEAGGPVTVTDKRITRYFMTIPEAVSLVLKAGGLAKNGELFVLDMGEPVKIIDLAENMVRLAGLKPYEDIAIVETGLRPGEKLYEELLLDTSKQERTADEKIFVEREEIVRPVSQIDEELAKLANALKGPSENADEKTKSDHIVQVLRELVPNYVTPREVDIHN